MPRIIKPYLQYWGETEEERKKQIGFLFYCPACKSLHRVAVFHAFRNGARWSQSGTPEKPSFHPSINISWGEPANRRCHFFVRDGMIDYCGDCTHDLRGRTVQMEPIPASMDPEAEGG